MTTNMITQHTFPVFMELQQRNATPKIHVDDDVTFGHALESTWEEPSSSQEGLDNENGPSTAPKVCRVGRFLGVE